MDPKYTDVNRTLQFSRSKILRKFFIVGLLCLGIGIYGSSFDNNPRRKPVAYISFVLGILLTGYALHHTVRPGKPVLVLSPAGIRLDIEWVKTFLIPWDEVRAVRKIDVTLPTRGWHRTFKDVTAVVVSKAFYDRVIHVSSAFQRGPGWDSAFIDNGDTVDVTLSYLSLPASAGEIYAAVEARWKAFRDKQP